VTAISVLASIYLQAVIAASMEDVELFLAPLTARSKVREVLRGLVATRQVHTISLGHAPHFYVAGTLPEFSTPPTLYASASIPASAYFMRSYDEELPEPAGTKQRTPAAPSPTAPYKPAEFPAPSAAATHKPAPSGKSVPARPHFSRPAAHSRDRKPSQSSSSSRSVRHTGTSSASGNGSNGKSRPAVRPSSSGAHSARSARMVSNRKPALTSSTKSGNSKRFSLAARPKHGAKKRG